MPQILICAKYGAILSYKTYGYLKVFFINLLFCFWFFSSDSKFEYYINKMLPWRSLLSPKITAQGMRGQIYGKKLDIDT